MARSTYTPPQVRGTWTDWATSFLTGLVALLNRTQKVDEEYEPARFIMKDTVTSARYLVTIVSGVWTLTPL